ncbi:cyclin-dependent kinase-like 3 isoform X3 [Cebus imitator]|uniref:cyclin-dependent kinase-like 3 isoform X3 n=1 Tax=Cebus imitator TaxID=2715852 RepID=UPI0018994CE2|nr:cyclin-dependent kinase-like 3 isoform X3 [Cebus imitator]
MPELKAKLLQEARVNSLIKAKENSKENEPRKDERNTVYTNKLLSSSVLGKEIEKEKKPNEIKVRVIKVKGGRGDTLELKKMEYESGLCQQDTNENVHATIEPPNPINPNTDCNGLKEYPHCGSSVTMPPINLTNSNLIAANLNLNLFHPSVRLNERAKKQRTSSQSTGQLMPNSRQEDTGPIQSQMEKDIFNEQTGHSDQMANVNKRKLNFSRSDRKKFHFPELPVTIQSKDTKVMEAKQIKMLKRESKKTDSPKIPTLLNADQNQEKQEVCLYQQRENRLIQ